MTAFETNEKKLALEKKKYTVDLSPDGNFIVWYETSDSSYYSYSVNISLKQGKGRIAAPFELSLQMLSEIPAELHYTAGLGTVPIIVRCLRELLTMR